MAPDKTEVPALPQATDFGLDIQKLLQERGQCMSDEDALRSAILETLPSYPGHEISDVLTFADGSVTKITTEGILVE